MSELCRRLERKYGLQEVLSPRAFQSPKDRLLPRHDNRKEKLKVDIRQTLKYANSYLEFERQIKELGYKVLKGRGISFIDDKKVKIKGSEVGFSLMKIEKILHQKQQYAMKNAGEEKNYDRDSQSISKSFNTEKPNKEKQSYSLDRSGEIVIKEVLGVIGQLINSEYEPDYIDPELQRVPQKKKKKSALRR